MASSSSSPSSGESYPSKPAMSRARLICDLPEQRRRHSDNLLVFHSPTVPATQSQTTLREYLFLGRHTPHTSASRSTTHSPSTLLLQIPSSALQNPLLPFLLHPR